MITQIGVQADTCSLAKMEADEVCYKNMTFHQEMTKFSRTFSIEK